MNTEVKLSEKEIADKKTNAIEKSKAEIKNPKSKNILDLDLETLDKANLKALITSKVKVKEVATKREMYHFERLSLSDKEIKRNRMKIRKQRNKFVSNILFYFSSDKEKELKNEIKSFNEFYKKTYTLNDYSIESIAQGNSDVETLEQIKIMFQILKQTK